MARRAALQLVDTKKLDRSQWLEVRRGGIGSSDAAAAVGLCPYKSPLELWMEKTGRTPAETAPPGMDDPRYWGTLLEPYVAVAYSQKTDRKVRRCNAVLQHPTFPFMLANIDREVVGDPDVRILECKTAGEFGSRLWKDGVPEYIQLQVQHQLAVTGHAAADVAVLLCGQALERRASEPSTGARPESIWGPWRPRRGRASPTARSRIWRRTCRRWSRSSIPRRPSPRGRWPYPAA